MFDLKTLWEILATVGLSGLVVIILAYAAQIILRVWANRTNAQTRQFNVSTQQEEIVNTFAVDFNAERRLWEDRHHKLQDEFMAFRISAAEREGGVKVLQDLLAQERTERREFERTVLEDNIKRDLRLAELEKGNQQSLDRIKELEVERDTLNKQNAEKTTAILLLEESQRELTTRLEQETNRANSLSNLVDRLQNVPATTTNATQPLPDARDVDDTVIPLLDATPSAIPQDSTPNINSIDAADVAAEEKNP